MTCLSGIQPACLEDCRESLLTRGCLTAFLPLAQIQSYSSTVPLLTVTSHRSHHELHRRKKKFDSLEVFTQLLQTLTPCTEDLWRGRREETTSLFLSLVLGIWVTTKHLILFCLLSRSAACFIEPWKHASNTQPTQEKTGLEKCQEEGKSSTVLIQFVSLILHGCSLFMLRSAQAAHTTNHCPLHWEK